MALNILAVKAERETVGDNFIYQMRTQSLSMKIALVGTCNNPFRDFAFSSRPFQVQFLSSLHSDLSTIELNYIILILHMHQ